MTAIIALMQNWRLLVGALGLVALIAAYQAGGNAERKRGDAVQLRVELATANRDAANQKRAADSANQKAAELTAEAQTKEDELDALRKKLAALPEADRDIAPADALDRLYPGQ